MPTYGRRPERRRRDPGFRRTCTCAPPRVPVRRLRLSGPAHRPVGSAGLGGRPSRWHHVGGPRHRDPTVWHCARCITSCLDTGASCGRGSQSAAIFSQHAMAGDRSQQRRVATSRAAPAGNRSRWTCSRSGETLWRGKPEERCFKAPARARSLRPAVTTFDLIKVPAGQAALSHIGPLFHMAKGRSGNWRRSGRRSRHNSGIMAVD